MLLPRKGYIIALPDEGSKTTSSGIILTEAQDKDGAKGKVITVASDVKHIKVGDNILFHSYSSTEITLEDKNYLIINAHDVMATINV